MSILSLRPIRIFSDKITHPDFLLEFYIITYCSILLVYILDAVILCEFLYNTPVFQAKIASGKRRGWLVRGLSIEIIFLTNSD